MVASDSVARPLWAATASDGQGQSAVGNTTRIKICDCECFEFGAHRGVGPEGALAAVAAGSAGRPGVLAEVVIAGDGLSAEVAHEAAAAARHPVAALRFDQARPTLDALPHPSCRHAFLAAAQRKFRKM